MRRFLPLLPLLSRRRAPALTIGAGLVGVYTFLYVTRLQQNYALLIGSIALFLVLAVVMWVTRRIDWYARDVDN